MLLLLPLLGASALAATPTSSSAPSSTSSSAVTTHSIAVGANGFSFNPNNITVPVGDIIEFVFYPGGHSVARSEYLFPCMPYDNYGINRAGFFSGITTPQVYTPDGPKFRVRVNDTAPIFYYCTAPGSCFKQHMIGVINPNSTQTFEKQLEVVQSATTQLTPGDPIPSETLGSSSGTPMATSQPTAAPTAPVASSSTSNNSGSNGLSSGAIAGIAIGAAAVLVLAAALIYICGRNSRPRHDNENRTSFPAGTMVDAKFTSPKSPGQATFNSNPHYSIPPGNDPYRNSPPMQQQQYTGGSTTSPPISPGSHPTYATYQNMGQHLQSPLMAGMEGTNTYHDHSAQNTPPPPGPHGTPPVELPTSADPGNSPIPPYADRRQMSWHQGEESKYRPGGKA